TAGYLDWLPLKLHASNEAVRRTRTALELVMALDNTGSMARESPSRMKVLKESAQSLVDTVLEAAEAAIETGAPEDVFIGLVPFTDMVNVRGIDSSTAWFSSWLERYPNMRNYIHNAPSKNSWTGCIAEPPGD